MKYNFAIIIPMANESDGFDAFKNALITSLDKLDSGRVYFVIDKATKDNTLELCSELSKVDNRFVTLWAPGNTNVVDAYLHGYAEALKIMAHNASCKDSLALLINPRCISHTSI